MVPDVAAALDRLSCRDTFTGRDDLVFVGDNGGLLNGSALRRRFVAAAKRAGLRPLRFHDLRHSFATAHALPVWMRCHAEGRGFESLHPLPSRVLVDTERHRVRRGPFPDRRRTYEALGVRDLRRAP